MNRNVQIERRIESNLDGGQIDADSFRLGAYWADSHPIFTDRIPVEGYKTPGEVLALANKLLTASNNNPAIKELYGIIKANIEAEKPPFEDIERMIYYRKDSSVIEMK